VRTTYVSREIILEKGGTVKEYQGDKTGIKKVGCEFIGVRG
jgi:hypothetical protein